MFHRGMNLRYSDIALIEIALYEAWVYLKEDKQYLRQLLQKLNGHIQQVQELLSDMKKKPPKILINISLVYAIHLNFDPTCSSTM